MWNNYLSKVLISRPTMTFGMHNDVPSTIANSKLWQNRWYQAISYVLPCNKSIPWTPNTTCASKCGTISCQRFFYCDLLWLLVCIMMYTVPLQTAIYGKIGDIRWYPMFSFVINQYNELQIQFVHVNVGQWVVKSSYIATAHDFWDA